MLRFSSILKKKDDRRSEKKEEPVSKAEVSVEKSPEPEVEESELSNNTLKERVKNLEKSLTEPSQPDQAAIDVYNGLISFEEDVVNRLERGQNVSYQELKQKIEPVVSLIQVNKRAFGSLTKTETANYVIGHQTNVCVLSIQIGSQMGYETKRLTDLGVAALLFDLGMVKVLNVVKQKRKLGEDEFDEVKNHTQYGVQILKQYTDLPQPIIDVAAQHHERPDGKGYPLGLKGREISEFSKIVSVADIYVALTHSRPERKGLSPHEAIKELLQNARFFSPNILRALLSVISIYPVGTWVELNSHDVGKVVQLNSGQPLRPVVELVCDHHGQPLAALNRVDLMEQPQLYITNVVSRSDIEKWGFS